MESNKKNGLLNLTKKATSIFGAALAALTGIQSDSSTVIKYDNLESTTFQVKGLSKFKPMPILKLNSTNLENGVFIAQHSSHASHSSHRSHYSHRSASYS